MALDRLQRLLCCFQGSDTVRDGQDVTIEDFAALASVHVVDKGGKKKPTIPEAITKQYAKAVLGDVSVDGQGVCLTTDVAVLGNVAITAGGTCVTGNVLVFGDVIIDGKDDQTVNGTCITGSVIVMGNAIIRGDVCVTSNVFVKGDLKVEGKLDVGGKLCYWGQKDVRPLPPT